MLAVEQRAVEDAQKANGTELRPVVWKMTAYWTVPRIAARHSDSPW